VSSVEVRPAAPWPPEEWNQLQRGVLRLLESREAWRNRARAAERRVGELEAALHAYSSGSVDPLALAVRADELARENQRLRHRFETARARVRRLLRRLDLLQEVR
jgi:hypothetical protein